MILVVLSNTGELLDDRDPGSFQYVSSTDPRTLQDRRRTASTARHDDKFSSSDCVFWKWRLVANLDMEPQVWREFHTTSSFVIVEQHAYDLRLHQNVQVRMFTIT